MGPTRAHVLGRPRPRGSVRAAASAALVAALATLTACGSVRELQRGFIFRPERATPRPERAEGVEGLERWWVEVEGGAVEAWYLPPSRTDEDGRAPAVIFAHGNQELIDDWVEELAPYREMGLAVLLPEYRSYGRSGGVPSEAGIVRDYAHFYDRLADRREVDGGRIVFHGRSLGGGVVGVLAGQKRAAALILESTFTNVPDLASRWWAPMGAITDRFDTRAVLLEAAAPTLILHGVEDDVVPFQHAVELDRVAWDSTLIAYRAGHSDLPRTEDAYWRRVRAFLTDARVIRPRRSAPDES